MRIDSCAFLPKARSEGIITKEVEGELLIYDRSRDRAHCLNQTAAAVWKLCNGRTSVIEISERLAVSRQTAGADGNGETAEGSRRKAVGREQTADSSGQTEDGFSLSTQHSARSTSSQMTPDNQIIWLALDQLRRSHLLEEVTAANEETTWPAAILGLENMSRREAVRRIGLGVAITLPIVISMTAPTAVEAAVSCGASCHPCSTPADCCGVCSNTTVPGCGPTTPRCT
jgi:hypothetical protein